MKLDRRLKQKFGAVRSGWNFVFQFPAARTKDSLFRSNMCPNVEVAVFWSNDLNSSAAEKC